MRLALHHWCRSRLPAQPAQQFGFGYQAHRNRRQHRWHVYSEWIG